MMLVLPLLMVLMLMRWQMPLQIPMMLMISLMHGSALAGDIAFRHSGLTLALRQARNIRFARRRDRALMIELLVMLLLLI